LRCTLLSCFAKRARCGKLPIAASTAVCRRLRCDLGPETSTNTLQLQGKLAIPVPRYRHPHATNNGTCSRDAPGPTNSLPLRPRIGAAERRSHRCSAHQHGSDGGHGMGHLPQDSQTRHRHGAPVRAQRGTPAPVPRARARTTRHARTCNVDGPGAGDDGPPAAGEGGTCCLRTSCRAS
jgi:hypothetical protein